MNTPDQGIRKAAILVASLDRASADKMLDTLDPQQARRVRQTMVGLGKIDSREQRRVIEEFFHTGPGLPDKYPPGVELDGRPARKLAIPQTPNTVGESTSPASASARPFRFLREAETEKLARLLSGERPQTIALVLSHLSSAQAGGVLARLQADLQVDVIRRLVDLEETDPEILREVERALQSRLSQQVLMQRRRVAGFQAVSGILEASEGRLADQILDNLSTRDRSLAERLSPPTLKFDDLSQFDAAGLKAVFQEAEPELAMTALVGAPPELIDRILRLFAAPEAKTVRQRLDHPGPIRLSDVEGARQKVADLARRLAKEGRIQLPNKTPLAA